MAQKTAPGTAKERREDSMSYSDRQSAVYQALVSYLGDGAADSTGEIDIWIQDCADDWVVWHSYTTSGPGPGDWKIGYVMDADGITFQGDPMAVVSHVSYLPADAAQLAVTVGTIAAEVRSLRSPAVVRREPLTYEKHTVGVSYFKDMFFRRYDQRAEARLQRHAQEMAAVNTERAVAAARGLLRETAPGGALAGAEFRTAPNRTQGTGGYFAVPLWLNEMFATAPRAPRVLASLIPCFDLPAGVSALNLPRLTTGNQATSTGDDAPAAGQDIVDAAVTSPVATIDGKGDFPKQLLEQSPAGAHLDWAMFKDLSEAYDASLEAQLVNGAGTGLYNDIQLQGIINVTGVNKQTFTTATPFYSSSATASNNLNTYIGQAGAQVGDNRKLPPELWLMTTSRWLWVATSVDNQNRPIVPPELTPPRHVRVGQQQDPDEDGRVKPVSSIAGFPVFVDDAIPTTFGAAANQDVVIACRPSDMILLEGVPQTTVTEEALSGTLGVRLVLRNYVAALTGRYPSGTSYITGTGLVVQSGY